MDYSLHRVGRQILCCLGLWLKERYRIITWEGIRHSQGGSLCNLMIQGQMDQKLSSHQYLIVGEQQYFRDKTKMSMKANFRISFLGTKSEGNHVTVQNVAALSEISTKDKF